MKNHCRSSPHRVEKIPDRELTLSENPSRIAAPPAPEATAESATRSPVLPWWSVFLERGGQILTARPDTIVRLPGGAAVRFPLGMNADQIRAWIERHYNAETTIFSTLFVNSVQAQLALGAYVEAEALSSGGPPHYVPP